MKPLLLASLEEIVAGIAFLIFASLLFYIPALVTSFLTGRRVKSGTFGPTLARPGDLPKMMRGLSEASIGVYNKIKSKLPAKSVENINNSSNLNTVLAELLKLKEDALISDKEYETLRVDLLQKYFSGKV
jgi:hypothetical protein